MIAGIIAEYNPFHNGHAYQIKKIKETLNPDAIVVIMSGSFVQRGEPACINKFDRTSIALTNGADIVLELPSVYSSAAADMFAFGACDILTKTNIIDYLCFGCENNNMSTLKTIADFLSNENVKFKNYISLNLSKGFSYPKARFEALSHFINEDLEFINKPNAILALEYIKALNILKSPIKPYIIKRIGEDYLSKNINSEFASASAIRNAFKSDISLCKPHMPQNSYSLFSSLKKIPTINDYTSIFNYIMITKKLQEISEICDITEGLENRIYENLSSSCISETIEAVKTKRYTYSKIQRAILHIILNIKKTDIENHQNPYIRILGFRSDKKNILSDLVKKSSVPIITNVKKAKNILSPSDYEKFAKEIAITDIYYLTQNCEKNMDFKHPLVVL